jgi:hypothetical protein
VAPAAAAPDDELAPPPPAHGLQFTWTRDAAGRIARAGAPAARGAAPSEAVAPGAAPVPSSQPPPLPAVSTPWGFRARTGAWADALAAKVASPIAGRVVRGALLHPTIYREAAASGELTREALLLAGAIVLSGLAGSLLGGFLGVGLLSRVALIRVVGWGCAIYAIQVGARSMHGVDLPVQAWFRALMYAQAPTLLGIVPGLATVAGLWSVVCAAAACHDLTGRDTTAAVVLAVIGAVAAAIGGYVVGAILL